MAPQHAENDSGQVEILAAERSQSSVQGKEPSVPSQNILKKRYNFRTLVGLSVCVSSTVSSVSHNGESARAVFELSFHFIGARLLLGGPMANLERAPEHKPRIL